MAMKLWYPRSTFWIKWCFSSKRKEGRKKDHISKSVWHNQRKRDREIVSLKKLPVKQMALVMNSEVGIITQNEINVLLKRTLIPREKQISETTRNMTNTEVKIKKLNLERPKL